ncbi:MAG TPA: hypothetical protein VMU51_35690 [Mycobacteriales bacterium]|nr:hypothetical protein [Mycobacteriales bacterium]
MTASPPNPLVEDYLTRLAAAASILPADQRAELLAGIREHIDAARAAAGDTGGEAAVRSLLDRLGDPAEIVAAAIEPPGSHGSLRPAASGLGPAGAGRETAAVTLLAVGALPGLLAAAAGLDVVLAILLALLGWTSGAVLLWTSAWWRPNEKLLGTLVVPGGLGLLVVMALLPVQQCVIVDNLDGTAGVETCTGSTLPPAVSIPLAAVLLIAPLAVAVVLLIRAQNRRHQAVAVIR